MKSRYFLILPVLFFLLSHVAYSQDIIYTKDFVDTIQCKIVKDNVLTLEFRYWNNSDTAINILNANEIEYYLISDNTVTNKNSIKSIVDTSTIHLSENRFNGITQKTYFYAGPKSLDDILKSNIKGHIEIKRKIRTVYTPRNGVAIFVKYNFAIDGIGNSRVGFGGEKLKPFLVKDEIVSQNISNYLTLRTLGLLSMYPIPFSIMVIGGTNDANAEIILPIAIAAYLTGKIIYHFIAIKSLRKAINRHNIIVSEMRKTQ